MIHWAGNDSLYRVENMEVKKPKILFDTDMDTDCDDAAALAILCEHTLRGDAELIGVVTDAVSKYAAPCCEVICKHYGVNVSIGAVPDAAYPSEETDRYDTYRAGLARFNAGKRPYIEMISAELGKCDTDYPTSETVYRRVLAAAEDGSVTVVCVGFLTAMARLFETEGDEISPLSGIELFRKKVKMVVSMGHAEVPTLESLSFNYDSDAVGAEEFFSKCPVPVYVSGHGKTVISGGTLTERLDEAHPLRRIYEKYNGGPSRGRMSWDQITTLYALNPDTPMLRADPVGTVVYHRGEGISHDPSGARADFWVYPLVSDEKLVQWIEAEMLGEEWKE